jgi:tRNA-Thr(GGU) m(6)t(6)A37 methyltransferase TsaA
MKPPRPGEVALPFDPGAAGPLTLHPIGRVHSPWSPGDCPKNLREARERGGSFALEIEADFRAGLAGLAPGDAVVLLYWTGLARRDLIVQAPAHAPAPRGVFALRSPARPNPVALAVTRITTLDAARGRVGVEALDAFDGTPLLDIKPWLPSVDVPSPA